MTTNNYPLILAVDDEPGIRRLLKLELTAQHFRVITANGGEEALELAEEQRPDAILLDILMPGMSGLETMRKLRERSSVPIILITAKDSDQDKVQGLGLGADDYIVKPFNPGEVSARIQAVLRRSQGRQHSAPVIKMDDLEIDLDHRLVMRSGEPVNLTRTEWQLLQYLAANAGRVLLNAELLSKVWGPEYRDDLQYLRVWVSRLRRKLEVEPGRPRLIKTKQGIGYLLDAQAAPTSALPEAAIAL